MKFLIMDIYKYFKYFIIINFNRKFNVKNKFFVIIFKLIFH